MKFVVVTERDCTERQAERLNMEPAGPLVHETYFEVANLPAILRRIRTFGTSMGWARPYLLLSIPQVVGAFTTIIFLIGGIAWLAA